MDFFDQLQDLNRPTVHKKPWMEAVTLTLASASDLDRIADECIAAKVYALDIETTGLDARVFTQPDGSKVTNDKIVGICIAPNEKQSYYLPIRHKDDGAAANVPPRLVRDMLLKIQAAGAVTVFHNGKFDQEFLEHDPAGAMGCWDDPAKWEDTILLAYLRDAREKRRGLKHLARTLLEREMIELNELFPTGTKRFDFSTLDPTWEPTVWYAAADALNTLALYHKLNPEVAQKDAFGKGQATVYKIEKLCVTATRWMERCRVPMDRNTITKLIKLGQREWFDSLAELYAGIETVLGRDVRPGWFKSMQGQHHRINAPFDSDCMEPSYMEHREQVIKDLGPDPDVKVPKSVPSLTDAKVRETVQFPNTYDVTIPTEIGLLLRELGVEGLSVTEKSGQVKTSKDELNRIVEEMGDDLPFAPKIKRFREVAKGLSSNLFPVYHDLAPENSPDGRLWVGFNATKTDTGRFSTPASESGDFTGQSRWNLHSIPATYDKSKPECVRKMRTSVKANAGKILFAIDYSGVELRIVTNLSGEPKWVDEFFRCSGCEHRFEKGSCPPHFCPSCGSDKIGDLHTLTALAIYGEDAATKSDFKQKRQNSKCVHPDTLIRMDSGYTRIGDLTFGGTDEFKPHSGKVLTPKGAFAPILETYNGGIKPLYHVVSRRGVLTCSEEHKFVLADGTQKSLREGLKAGDTLHAPVFLAADEQEPKALSHKAFVGVPGMAYTPTMATAYFSGLHAGDGASSTACATITHGSVEKTDALGVRYSEWQEIIMAACRDVGLEPIARKKNVYLGSRHVLRWMQTLGLVDGSPPTKRTLRVPRWILQSGRSAMAHYLGGLIDTDGSVTRGGDISICTKDFVFAGQIAEIIRAIGGEATITTSWNKKYSRWYVKVGFKRRDGALVAPYMRHPGKLARISGTSKSYDRMSNDVLLVVPAGDSLCLDLHIDSEDHLYAANGLAVHNSLNFAMCYGGGGSAAQRSVGVDKEEGWRIKRQFDKSYRGLAKWWEEQHKTARKQKYVTTAYGRKYPLPDIDHTDGGFRSKAERNSVNGPVQGCLHPDTKITTSSGLITVRDLYHDGASFKVWTGQEWANARPLYSGHKIVCVTGFTSGNTIKTSPEHLFLTWRDQTQSPKNMGDVVEWIRQQELKIGDWVATSTEASDIAPPHLVKWAGETIYASSIYASLSKGQKSAVLRLKAGSGSRFQCAEYLNKVPDAEIPADLSKLLRYSWEKVTSSQNTGETVEMFDVEVFDDFHAFVADGCVVHNTSADIMKFAMGLIYRECKERGWLDRAKMCVTIHDELVFEIDEDLAEEAVMAINELMTVRTVKNLGWIIPLKNDIEFGDDWTVPFNLVAMTNPREVKPEVWSERWQRVFPKFYAEYLANGGTGEAKAVVEPTPVAAPIANTPEFVMPISSQSRHVYMIPAHRLTPELAEIMARVVAKCMGRGKDEIVIETDHGMDLLGFSFKASFAEFKIIAGYEGL
jgi:DNA polymerase I-like protein with 3'-5' exonuclease and polymerase domains